MKIQKASCALAVISLFLMTGGSAIAEPKADPLGYLLVPGCDGGKKLKLKSGPIIEHKDKLFERYSFFISKQEKKIFENCLTIEATSLFFEKFWDIRDPDRSTPENEYKDIIDSRIDDIESEIFFGDSDIPGTTFARNGGLKRDMARVYLLRGEPHYKIRLENMNRLADLMAWVYFDASQRPLFVFLFVDKGQGYKVFTRHIMMDTPEAYMDALKEISKYYPTSASDYEELYLELDRYDREYIFRFAIRQFSYYSDIRIDKVLSVPTIESITAKEIQPKILGVPNIPVGTKMVMNPFSSTIPGFFRLSKDRDGIYHPTLLVTRANIDWEDKGALYEAKFDALVTVTNEKTRERQEFSAGMTVSIPASLYVTNKDGYFSIRLADLENYSIGAPANTTLSGLMKSLKPGDYEIRVRFFNRLTFKSGEWFEYITVH